MLEKLFPTSWLEKHILAAVLLAAGYSVISLSIASFIFPQNTGLVSLVFLSLLIVPSMKRLFAEESNYEEQETSFSLAKLYTDNKRIFKTYLGIFLGVFTTYFCASAFLPLLGIDTFSLMQEQLFIDRAIAGRAFFEQTTFMSILANNWLVLVVTFVLALLIGDGAVFFVAWNASAWGAVFGYRAFAASTYTADPILLVAATLLAIVAAHVLLEGGAYILAAISGSIISTEVIKNSDELHRFLGYALSGVILYALLSKLATGLPLTNRLLISIPVLLAILYVLRYCFTNKKHQEVYVYNYWLFVTAIAVFITGSLVETIVLSNSNTLNAIYQASAAYTTS